MKFQLFSNNTTYISNVANLLELHFNVLLFFNQGDKVLKTIGQIFLLLSTIIKILSPSLENNVSLKFISDSFPTMLTYVVLLENCFIYMSTYWWSPFQATRFIFMLKFYVVRISEFDIDIK